MRWSKLAAEVLLTLGSNLLGSRARACITLPAVNTVSIRSISYVEFIGTFFNGCPLAAQVDPIHSMLTRGVDSDGLFRRHSTNICEANKS